MAPYMVARLPVWFAKAQPSLQVRITLPDSPELHGVEALLEVLEAVAVGDHRGDVQARLEHDGHLVPGLVHLAAVDALDGDHVEDDRAASRWRSRWVGMPSMAILPPWHMLASMSRKALGVARHLQADVEALLHAELFLGAGDRPLADVDGQGRPHLAGQLEAVRVDVGDDDVPRAGVADDRSRP